MHQDPLAILFNQLYILNCMIDRDHAGPQYISGYICSMETFMAFCGLPFRLERIGDLYHLFNSDTGGLLL